MNVALITARGGSKGLPRKNVLPLAGKPLIAWTIEAALESAAIDKVFVSTEDQEIAEISSSYGANIIARPLELASDQASSEAVVEHAIQFFKANGVDINTLALLQPTSPLRTAQHIDSAFEQYEKNNADMVLSVFEPEHTPVKAYISASDGSIKGLYSEEAPYSRRQDLPKAYQPNGAIYIFNVEVFMENVKFPRHNVYPFVMSSSDSTDIDTQQDLILAEQIYRENRT